MKAFAVFALLLVCVSSLVIDGVEVTGEYIDSHPLMRIVSGRQHIPLEPVTDSSLFSSFTQELDHFNSLDNRQWTQRYSVDDSHWSPGNPIFIFLDGEAPMDFFRFQEVTPFHWAKEFNAMYVSLEHRYYGKSLPFLDFTSDNMQYLSSQQALADAANFIDQFNATIDRPGPWVVFGCSYSGALSSWFRAKYPNSVIGSVAPSGPVYAQSNFTRYFGQFEESVNMIGYPSCNDAVSSAVASIDEMLMTPSGISNLEHIFNSCTPLNQTDTPNWFFKMVLMNAVGGSDQMDNAPSWPLNDTCDKMTATDDYVANWATVLGTDTCNSFSQKTFLDLASLTIPSGSRSWWWQKCTEFGFFKPSYPGTSIFWGDIPVEPMIDWCSTIFGVDNMAPDTEWTNTYYGGYNLKASNVMFTNGLLDPWHNLSINQNFTDGSVQSVTYDAGHCATMDLPDPSDPTSLVNARVVVHDFLQNLLAPYQQ